MIGGTKARELLRHSAMYALAQLLPQLASIVLLPFYTRYLTSTDYGHIAVLDLTATILSTLAAGGIAIAAMRFHFDPKDDESRHDVWVTGLVLMALLCLPQVAVAWFGADWLAHATFGPELEEGTLFCRLTILTLPANLFNTYCSTYLRALKWSGVFTAMSAIVLLAKITLNIYMIGFLKLGVLGFLYSNLIVGVLQALVFVGLLFLRKRFQPVRSLLVKFWHYSWPFAIAGLASLVMHQADRYVLRWLLADKLQIAETQAMAQIGVFALAFNMIQGVNTLLTSPFFFVWIPLSFEVNQKPERLEIFERVFKYFVIGYFLVLLGIALERDLLVRLVAGKEEFYAAAHLMPLFCLAFLLFPLHTFFSLPATLHKKTVSIAAVSVVAAIVKVVSAIVFINRYGLQGAPLSSVLTYAVYSGLGHLKYRKIERLRFGFYLLPLLLAIGAIAVRGIDELWPDTSRVTVRSVAGLVAWSLCAVGLALGPARPLTERAREWVRGLPAARKRARSAEERIRS